MIASGQLAVAERMIEERFGLSCTDWQKERLAAALAGRARGSPDASQLSGDELRALAEELIVGETYFFRDRAQIDAYAGVALPACAAGAPGRPIRVLSAGCSSGEEAYSLAIAAARTLPAGTRVEITGIDISNEAIRRARIGRYSAWALRGAPADVVELFFRREGAEHRIVDEVRSMVSFEQQNLLDAGAAFWSAAAFDVVFCRNVTIYFSERSTRAAIANLGAAIAPGGFLFLGYSETLRGLSGDFELANTHDTFYYRRRSHDRATAPGALGVAKAARPRALPVPQRTGATARPPAAREEVREPAPIRPSAPPAASCRAAMAKVLAHLAAERFDEALAELRAAAAAGHRDPEADVALGVIRLRQGRLADAERAARDLLAAPATTSDRFAEACYLLAACAEQRGDRAEAEARYREALRADATFAMPRLHLGMLARRAGERDAALTELRRAFDDLRRERADRLALFGDGFGRAALLDLCSAAIRALAEDR